MSGGWTEGILFCFEETKEYLRILDAFGKAFQAARLGRPDAAHCSTKDVVLTVGTKPK